MMIKRGFLLASLLVIAALAIQTLSVASPVGNENTSSVLNASTTLEPIDSGALNVSVDVSDSIRLFRTESSGNELSTATENQTELNAMFIRLFEIDDKLIEEDIFVNQCVNQTINGTATPQIYGLKGEFVFDSGVLDALNVSDSNSLYPSFRTARANTDWGGNELITDIQTELNAMFLRLFEINDKLIEEDIFVNQSANQTINGTATPHYGLSGRLVFNNVNIVNHARDIGVYLYVVTD
ncbi:MAG: hypothetical protein HYX24_05605 [Candidatus Aenigmarchaeota archaeon]|nr:hypothetical protein [Candidatus Aenigmarchaeota archaeon]